MIKYISNTSENFFLLSNQYKLSAMICSQKGNKNKLIQCNQVQYLQNQEIDPTLQILSRRSYHQGWSMGATFIVFNMEIAQVLSGTHLSTQKRWKAELGQQREDIRRSVGMIFTENPIRITYMVAQLFTNYSTQPNIYIYIKSSQHIHQQQDIIDEYFTNYLENISTKTSSYD